MNVEQVEKIVLQEIDHMGERLAALTHDIEDRYKRTINREATCAVDGFALPMSIENRQHGFESSRTLQYQPIGEVGKILMDNLEGREQFEVVLGAEIHETACGLIDKVAGKVKQLHGDVLMWRERPNFLSYIDHCENSIVIGLIARFAISQ